MASLQLPADVETWPARAGRRVRARGVPGPRRARVLLPEGGDGPARHALRARAEGAGLRDRHQSPLPGDVRRSGRRSSAATTRRSMDFAGEPGRGRPLGEESRPLSRDREGRAAQPRARSTSTAGSQGSAATSRRRARTRRSSAGTTQHELWKANPLADWSDDDCWAYIRERGLPYNALHDQGYDSIGDTHSTLPGKGREGRWAGTERTECGLHTWSGT